MTQTYDGATTALRRWSKRWKALAKSYRQRHVWNGEVIERQQRALEQAETSDGAMVLTLQLTEARQRIEELTGTIALQDAVLRASNEREATERAAREQDVSTMQDLLDICSSDLDSARGERDTALARVKELEEFAGRAALANMTGESLGIQLARLQAAETALASVRKRVQDWMENGVGPIQSCGYALQHLLTSRPSPAPVAEDVTEHTCSVTSDEECPVCNPAPVAAPCAGCAELRKNWDACHRQHEQCMKLLTKAMPHLAGLPVYDLIDEMLERGELPKGWDK